MRSSRMGTIFNETKCLCKLFLRCNHSIEELAKLTVIGDTDNSVCLKKYTPEQEV